MSEIVTTKLGRFRRVTDDGKTKWWLWECPKCEQWCSLSDEQWAGRISVDHASDGCSGKYHETHDFGAELIATMQARRLMDEPVLDRDDAAKDRGMTTFRPILYREGLTAALEAYEAASANPPFPRDYPMVKALMAYLSAVINLEPDNFIDWDKPRDAEPQL